MNFVQRVLNLPNTWQITKMQQSTAESTVPPQSSQRARLLQPRRQHLELPRFDSWNAVLRAKGAMAGHGKTAKFQPVLMDEHLQFDLQLLTFLEDCQPAMRRLGELLGFCEPHAVALEAQQCIYTNCNIKLKKN